MRVSAAPTGTVLACIPHAGAGVSVFRDWPRLLGEQVTLALVQLPGREDRLQEVLTQSLASLVAQLAGELLTLAPRRLVIFGHSMGASLAWAVAGRLWDCHGVRATLVLSAQSPQPRRLGDLRPTADLRGWFARMGEPYPEALDYVEVRALFCQAFEHDLAWMDRELAQAPAGPYPFDVHGLYGRADGLVDREAMAQWATLTTGSFALSEIPGGHLYPVSAQQQLVDYLKPILVNGKRHAATVCP
ncbi:alpha/beta fold hydrolase [Pseudomonas sp. dw_612]|uniref:thioesterase II family protein n=1 Tax=Pseudomonas sp. dw_612 TaxID=2720080 RepID=UPI001BD397AA|nr:alpha/beta fold hydrolase [Pseudomonas sp. dw_612]